MKRPTTKRIAVMKATSVDKYFASLPRNARPALKRLRRTIRSIVPEATEVISYGMPTFKLDRMIVAYAAFQGHYSLFPLSSTLLDRYQRDAGRFRSSKGTLQFAYDEPLPESLVRKIVNARVKELREKRSARKNPKRASSSKLKPDLSSAVRRKKGLA
jgi:uncharacterized protein YdhG (YjbR/CyaY superfamily)